MCPQAVGGKPIACTRCCQDTRGALFEVAAYVVHHEQGAYVAGDGVKAAEVHDLGTLPLRLVVVLRDHLPGKGRLACAHFDIRRIDWAWRRCTALHCTALLFCCRIGQHKGDSSCTSLRDGRTCQVAVVRALCYTGLYHWGAQSGEGPCRAQDDPGLDQAVLPWLQSTRIKQNGLCQACTCQVAVVRALCYTGFHHWGTQLGEGPCCAQDDPGLGGDVPQRLLVLDVGREQGHILQALFVSGLAVRS